MSIILLALLVALPVLDSGYRLLLLLASRRWPRRRGGQEGQRYLVLIPARAEGAAVGPTLSSVQAAGRGCQVETILILDGADPVAAETALGLGVEAVIKTPSGPTKGAVLAWASQHLSAWIEACDAVFVLDVGSTLSEDFFSRLLWPAEADGVQAFLAGSGEGPGGAAAHSERLAQRLEDCGREVLGWSVRLRGTGFALRPPAFVAVVSCLVTKVEDLEMSMLLAGAGARLVMGPESALVHDEKPAQVAAAARQRARWIVGRLAVGLRHPRAFLRLLLTRPFEGPAFVAEIVARPLSLTVPFRLGIAVLAGVGVLLQWMAWPALIIATIAAGSALADIAVHIFRPGFSLRETLCLALSWLRALTLIPQALLRWTRAR